MENYSKRPWGSFEVLSDGTECKVKRISVESGKRLSYQLHKKRNEHWYIVTGNGIVTLNDEEVQIAQGDSIDILRETPHRIHNHTDKLLVFIEIQTGEYFGEDDIIRFSDDFGRT